MRRGRLDQDAAAEGVKNSQGLSDLDRRFSCFELTDQANANPRSTRELVLPEVEALPRAANDFT